MTSNASAAIKSFVKALVTQHLGDGLMTHHLEDRLVTQQLA